MFIIWRSPVPSPQQNRATLFGFKAGAKIQRIKANSRPTQGQLNNKREGKFETTTGYEDFDIFITAEDNPRAESPSEPKLLKGTMQP